MKGELPLISKDDSKGESGFKRKGATGTGLAPAVLEGSTGLVVPEPKPKKKKTAGAGKAKEPKDAKDDNEPEETAEGDVGAGDTPVRRVVAHGAMS